MAQMWFSENKKKKKKILAWSFKKMFSVKKPEMKQAAFTTSWKLVAEFLQTLYVDVSEAEEVADDSATALHNY